jgi:ATP-dependent Clp protease ATP-binding subunit ClpB
MAESAAVERLRGMPEHLRARIRGQDHVLSRVCGVFQRGELGLADPTRPRGSLLLAGPTGTGKTETFTCATEYVFGPGHFVIFDMSEYAEESALGKLLGTGCTDPGLLGHALAKLDHGAVLFDEFEKAHPRLWDVFLQILWPGRVTLATGQVIDFTRHYIGFTTNVGGVEAIRMERSCPASVEQMVLRRLGQSFRPEFLGRLDERLVFSQLSHEVQREICGLEVTRESSRLRRLGYDLEITREALEWLTREGFHPHLGARPTRKAVEQHLQQAVVRSLFATGSASGKVALKEDRGGLVVLPGESGRVSQ